MSGYWEINGVQLGNNDARVLVTTHSSKLGVRQGKEAIHGGTEYRERVGKDLPALSARFTIVGRGQAKYEVAQRIQEAVEDDKVWSLQAPTLTIGDFAYLANKRVALSTNSVDINTQGPARIDMDVSATVNGIWIADGGTYCEPVTGHFTLTSTGPSVLTRDDGTATGATPLVRLPQQTSGYPTAVRASDFAEVQLTQSGSDIAVLTDDGNTVYEQDYDMTGFLIPAPSTAGDVGLYQICSSPTDDYLSGGEGALVTIVAGMASAGMASGAMATV